VAVIIDLDALCDADKMVAISKVLIADPTVLQESIETLQSLAQLIKSLRPLMSEDDAKARMRELSDASMDWKKGDDNVLRRKLNELGNQLKRIHRLKEGGIDAYTDAPEIQTRLNEVVEQFGRIGVFFVPVGELEDWVKPLMPDMPKGSMSKTDRAAIAAARIRASIVKTGDIWAFVQNVFDYLQRSSE
jgi:hypothetical protein